jgi:hypothetical protein
MRMSHVLILILQALAILALVAAAEGARRWMHLRMPRRVLAASAIASVAAGVAVANVVTSARALDAARRAAVPARAGTTTCGAEDSASKLIPYLNWLRSRLPRGAVYTYVGVPAAVTQLDGWCSTLALLPRLPSGPGGAAHWTYTLGVTPPWIQALINAHSHLVTVYAPGLELVREAPPR